MNFSLRVNLLPDPDKDVWVTIQDEYIFSHQIVLVEVVYLNHVQQQLNSNSWSRESVEQQVLDAACRWATIFLTSFIPYYILIKQCKFNTQECIITSIKPMPWLRSENLFRMTLDCFYYGRPKTEKETGLGNDRLFIFDF